MSEIRKYFISRWGGAGVLMEFDFSQLEVVALAHLSDDEQLQSDIRTGIDMHTTNAAAMFHKPESDVTPEERKVAKGCTFQLQYGAGYKSMAKSWNITEQTAKDFINAYYARYPQVEEWQDNNIKLVESGRYTTDERTPKGFPKGKSKLKSETGRLYTFSERDIDKSWRFEDTGFYSTEIKNYPVQGFATGDIVPMILGKVYRRIKQSPTLDENCKMVNTVHDSILFDVTDGAIRYAYDTIKQEMERVPEYLKKYFNIDFHLPINVDCKVGKNWLDMKDYS